MRAPAHHVHRDAELLSRWHRIHAFLRLKGMPPLRVFTVLKHQSKVAVLRDPELLSPGAPGPGDAGVRPCPPLPLRARALTL